jgi:hypothetical protein
MLIPPFDNRLTDRYQAIHTLTNSTSSLPARTAAERSVQHLKQTQQGISSSSPPPPANSSPPLPQTPTSSQMVLPNPMQRSSISALLPTRGRSNPSPRGSTSPPTKVGHLPSPLLVGLHPLGRSSNSVRRRARGVECTRFFVDRITFMSILAVTDRWSITLRMLRLPLDSS